MIKAVIDTNVIVSAYITKELLKLKKTAFLARNKYICELADNILFIGVT